MEEPEGVSTLVTVSTAGVSGAGVSRAGVSTLAAVSAVAVNVLEEAKAVGVSAVATAEREQESRVVEDSHPLTDDIARSRLHARTRVKNDIAAGIITVLLKTRRLCTRTRATSRVHATPRTDFARTMLRMLRGRSALVKCREPLASPSQRFFCTVPYDQQLSQQSWENHDK